MLREYILYCTALKYLTPLLESKPEVSLVVVIYYPYTVAYFSYFCLARGKA